MQTKTKQEEEILKEIRDLPEIVQKKDVQDNPFFQV